MLVEWSPGSRLGLVVGASVLMVLALLAGGCGGVGQDSGAESRATTQLTSSRVTVVDRRKTGEIKPVRWSVVAERRRSLRLGVEVPYCGYREPEPFIERVERRLGRDGLVFTVFVRFGPEDREPGGCVGEALILGKWVRVGQTAKSKPLFDGSTSPPSRRHLS
jgi:hypothetical protein